MTPTQRRTYTSAERTRAYEAWATAEHDSKAREVLWDLHCDARDGWAPGTTGRIRLEGPVTRTLRLEAEAHKESA